MLAELTGAAGQTLDRLPLGRGLRSFNVLRRLAQSVECGAPLLARTGRGLSHRIRGFLQPARGLGELGGILVAREFLELARLLLHLTGEVALRTAGRATAARRARQLLRGARSLAALLTAACLTRTLLAAALLSTTLLTRALLAAPLLLTSSLLQRFRHALLPIVLLLLPRGELLQLFLRRIERLLRGARRLGARCFVLVLQLVGLQFEQVGKVLRAGAATSATTASTTAAAPHRDITIGGVGRLQVLQRPLLGGNRVAHHVTTRDRPPPASSPWRRCRVPPAPG